MNEYEMNEFNMEKNRKVFKEIKNLLLSDCVVFAVPSVTEHTNPHVTTIVSPRKTYGSPRKNH